MVRSGSSKNYTFNTSRLPSERTVRVSEMCSVSTIQDYESALFPVINVNTSATQYAQSLKRISFLFGVKGGQDQIHYAMSMNLMIMQSRMN